MCAFTIQPSQTNPSFLLSAAYIIFHSLLMSYSVKEVLGLAYVISVFCCVFSLGAFKGLLIGPVAGSVIIAGDISVILGLFPCHVIWTVDCIVKTARLDAALKAALLFALFPLSAIWLGIGIAGSIFLGVGYGFFTPWVSAFEAFRQERESKRFLHCIMDGTWGTIKGSCTVVRDFTDFCYYSYPQYLNELKEASVSNATYMVRFVEVPAIILVGLMGLLVEIPVYTAIAILKSPYMLFKGWQRLLQDLISREGLFLESACVPVAGLAIILWPLVVAASVLLAIFSSFFVGLYGSVVVYQERSFRRGVAYVIAMVSEFDEYTNDWLYLREGSVLPKPRYRRKKTPLSSEFSVGGSKRVTDPSGAPSMLVPSLAPSKSVKETIQEVKMVQIWECIMMLCEMKGKFLIDEQVIMSADLHECFKAKEGNLGTIVGIGIPCYVLLTQFINSIRAGSTGLLLIDGIEVNQRNRPHDRILDWFFHPMLILMEQIKVMKMSEGELRFLEKCIIFANYTQRMDAWENGSVVPQDAIRLAQIQAVSRRLVGMTRSIVKLPTYRRKFQQVVKVLVAYCEDRNYSSKMHPFGPVISDENV